MQIRFSHDINIPVSFYKSVKAADVLYDAVRLLLVLSLARSPIAIPKMNPHVT